MVYLRKNKACSKSAVPLQFALDYVYQDLKQKHAKYQHIWDKKQRYKWDRQPITNEQIALIHKLAPDYKIDTHKMTRGDASPGDTTADLQAGRMDAPNDTLGGAGRCQEKPVNFRPAACITS